MITFPEGFLWGAATASYQIEGSPLADGAGPSVWHQFAHTPGNTAGGDTGDIACDHYRRYPEDLALMRRLGLGAYRFSIAWPRILPGGTGAINQAGLDFYSRLVDGLLEAGIVPFATLFHWDLPAALQDRGGWTNRESADWFAEYAHTVFLRLGDRVCHWITFNEPFIVVHEGHAIGEHAPGHRNIYEAARTAHHILLGHAKAVEIFRQEIGQGEIGITVILSPVHAASETEEDRHAARLADAYQNRLFLDPLFFGTYPDELDEVFGDAWPEAFRAEAAGLRAPVDFIGVNYYSRVIAASNPGIFPSFREEDAPTEARERTQMGWEIYPEGLYEVLQWAARRYGGPRLYVTESGAAFPDPSPADGRVADLERKAFLREHFLQAHRAIREGVDLCGYFVWSLLDNFEWALGYSRRFGIVHVDYATQARTIKDSGLWYAEVIGKNGFEESV